MGQTLNVASEKKGYTLADRGTYLALKKSLGLDILVEGDACLLNIYHVIEVNPAKWPKVNVAGRQGFRRLHGFRRRRPSSRPSASTNTARPSFSPMPARKRSPWANKWILILDGIRKALSFLSPLTPRSWGSPFSLKVSGVATLISLFIGISVGTVIALSQFPGRQSS